MQADIVKQKFPETNGGFSAINFDNKKIAKIHKNFSITHPIDMVRHQVVNCFMGRVGLINSGGESSGKNDLKKIILSAIINKRAGGMGMIVGRKAFQKNKKDGINLLYAIQDVYLENKITIA